jgi:hypothetical protein
MERQFFNNVLGGAQKKSQIGGLAHRPWVIKQPIAAQEPSNSVFLAGKTITVVTNSALSARAKGSLPGFSKLGCQSHFAPETA